MHFGCTEVMFFPFAMSSRFFGSCWFLGSPAVFLNVACTVGFLLFWICCVCFDFRIFGLFFENVHPGHHGRHVFLFSVEFSRL